MALTIQDIAIMSQTSKSTVSRYLNGGSISKPTADKIKKVIEVTQFEANITASRLKRKKSNLIGVLFEGFESISVQRMLASINTQLRKTGYLPFMMLDEVDETNRTQNVRALVNQGVDGIIYGAGTLTQEQLQYLTTAGVPVILVGQRNEYLPFLKINDYQAGFQLGQHLSQHQYQKVVLLTRPESDKAIGVERKNGFIDGINSINKPNEVVIMLSSFDIHSNYALAKNVWNYKPDLVVGSTDRMITGIIEYLNEHHIKIPDEVAVAGFGNYEYGKAIIPQLTSVDLDYASVGTDAARNIVNLINQKEIKKISTEYNIKIIDRASTIL